MSISSLRKNIKIEENLRNQVRDEIGHMTCTNAYFTSLTGVNFQSFENFGHGFSKPSSQMIERYKNALKLLKKIRSGEFTPEAVFDRFYIEGMNTQEIAISLNVSEDIIERCMHNHPKIRKQALVRRAAVNV